LIAAIKKNLTVPVLSRFTMVMAHSLLPKKMSNKTLEGW